MPQNKPMKIQWVTINGRQTPFVLPQVWNEDLQDWVVTGDVNPLPTKDDLVLSKLTDLETKLNGVLDIQVTGSNVEQVIITATGSGSVTPGQRESIIVQLEAGYVYEIMSVSLLIENPSGATTGNHRMYLRPANHVAGFTRLLDAVYNFDKTIRYDGEYHIQDPLTVIPTSKTNKLEMVKGFLLSDKGLELRYENNTDAENAKVRRVIMAARKIKVVT